MNLSNSQSYFFVQARSCASEVGEWPADQKEVARSRPPWHGVQPKVVAGCMDSLPTIRWKLGCVRKTVLIFGSSKPFRSAATWHVVQRSTFGIFMKLTLMNWSGSCTWLMRSDGLIMSRIGELRSWKSVSCFMPAYFVRTRRNAAVFFSIVVSISDFFALIASSSFWVSACCFRRSARCTVRSSSSLTIASSSFLTFGAVFGVFARASSYW